MIHLLTICLALVLATLPAPAEENVPATLYRNPDCACCEKYADYLRSNGFDVTIIEAPDMTPIKRKNGVGEDLEGCHTTLVGGYVVEGHVPATSIKRLLKEKPAIKGISLPGMPEGSPGMSGTKAGPFEILSIPGKAETALVFAHDGTGDMGGMMSGMGIFRVLALAAVVLVIAALIKYVFFR